MPGFNDSVRALAATEGVTLVDVYQAFGGNLALLGPDGLHPSADGYAKIARPVLHGDQADARNVVVHRRADAVAAASAIR